MCGRISALERPTLYCTSLTFLRTLSRTSDIVVRYGGEEFALLLPESDLPSAEALEHRLREQVECHTFRGTERLPGKGLTISVGIASYMPPDTGEALLKAADTALYRAKREGRNRVVVWKRDPRLYETVHDEETGRSTAFPVPLDARRH